MRKSAVSYLYDYANCTSDAAFVYRRRLRRTRWSYSRLAATAFQFARELEARGVCRNDRVIIWGENCPEWVAAFYGCLLRGAIAVPLDEQSTTDFVAHVQERVEPKLILCDSHCPSDDLSLPRFKLEELSEKVSNHSTEPYPSPDIKGNETAEIIFTSGTTAAPKGVCLTHDNLMANLEALETEINKYIKWERFIHPLRILCLLPLSHVFGQFMGMFVPPLLWAEVIFLNTLNPSRIIETVKHDRISVVATVPRVLQTLQSKIERDFEAQRELDEFKKQLSSAAHWKAVKRWWKFRKIHQRFGLKFWAFVTGGATLETGTEEFWRRLGFVVVQGYGMTETAALISLNNPFDVKSGSLGEVMAGQELKLDESGEIIVRGKNVTPGYWGEDSSEQSAEGWFRTGDVGEQDASGRLYFKGRKKDVIVTAAGLNVYPEDIEEVLNRQPEISGSAVIGIEGVHGEEPAAALIFRQGYKNAESAVARANESLAPHQKIKHWVIWDEPDFPRTATQKIRKPLIAEFVRQQIGGKQIGGKQTAQAPSVLSNLISRVSGAKLAEINHTARLSEDLKLDSLARVELLSAIEDRYQIAIDESSFTAATTLGDIERIIQSEGLESQAQLFSYPRWTQRFFVRWFRLFFYYLVTLPFTLVLCWVRVRGKEHLTSLQGPVIFASNHVTAIDAALIMSAMPSRFRRSLAIAMDGEMLQGWRHPPTDTSLFRRIYLFVKYILIILLFNVFPLPRHSGFRKSFEYAGDAMDRGHNILIFPEGQRTEDGKMLPFQHGIGILATHLETAIVPVRIDGLYELKAKGRRFFALPNTVSVSFGELMTINEDENAADVANKLERCVAELT
jgi:long-chain acyl-CoA synthetase